MTLKDIEQQINEEDSSTPTIFQPVEVISSQNQGQEKKKPGRLREKLKTKPITRFDKQTDIEDQTSTERSARERWRSTASKTGNTQEDSVNFFCNIWHEEASVPPLSRRTSAISKKYSFRKSSLRKSSKHSFHHEKNEDTFDINEENFEGSESDTAALLFQSPEKIDYKCTSCL